MITEIMELLQQLIQFVLHIDTHLQGLCTMYGVWIYGILFLVIFCETGLVVTPFLPGDSLLFAIGSLAAIGAMRVELIIPLLMAAALTGDNTNYWIGRKVGPKVFSQETSRFFNKEYLDRTNRFYDNHGKITVVLARFLPIIRTFAPFVAGIGRMTYRTFLLFSIIGALLWVTLFVLMGYFFGTIPFIKQHFSLVILALVLIPGMPALIEFIRHIIERRKQRSTADIDK
ncbi:MAG: DedA family protein [Ignavibacteriales bacterium]|nr:DedA family protein [Ignavibacteriales bacterium]